MNNPISLAMTQRVLTSTALLAAVALLAGCASSQPSTAAAGRSSRERTATAGAAHVRSVEYTGSRIPARVTGKLKASDLAVNMNVVDPNSPMNQGHPTLLDTLTTTPWAYPGYRGY